MAHHGRGSRALTAATLLALVATTASAAKLRTSDGRSIEVRVLDRIVLPLGALGSGGSVIGGGLGYRMVDGRGGRHEGTIAGTQDLRGHVEIGLAAEPAGGDVFVVYTQPAAIGSQLRLTAWTGLAWSSPVTLQASINPMSSPVLAFRPGGDALLPWTVTSGRTEVLLRNVDLAAAGEGSLHAFVDLGDVEQYLQPVVGDVRLRGGVAHVVADTATENAFVFLADPDSDRMGIMALQLDVTDDGTGIGAAPVPVILDSQVTPASEDRTLGGTANTSGAVGQRGYVIHPYRMELFGAEAYYWVEGNVVRAVAFRDGEPGRLVLTEVPGGGEAEAHVAAYQAIRRELLQDGDTNVALGSRRLGGHAPRR